MFLTMNQPKTLVGLQLGQPGKVGYYAFGNPLAQDFQAIKAQDAINIGRMYGNRMKEVVTKKT